LSGITLTPIKNAVVGIVKFVLVFPLTRGEEINEQEVGDTHWYIGGLATFGGRRMLIDMIVVDGPGLFRTTDR
jgi:hypothetical protein